MFMAPRQDNDDDSNDDKKKKKKEAAGAYKLHVSKILENKYTNATHKSMRRSKSHSAAIQS